MLRKTTFLLVLLFLAGCSAYKELKPKPEVVAQEGEYIELRKGDKNFELKKDKRYFLSFPAVAEPNFYLVLQSADLPRLTTYLTRVKPKKDQNPVKMDDQDSNASNDVFALDGTVASFYWVVEGIREDMKPSISYRYMPIWRYRFETKSAEFQLTLEQNRVGRQEFDGLGTTVPISDIVPGSKLSDAQRKNDVLKGIQGEMLEIESIFPPRIRNSNDKAYLAYQDFRAELNEELQFQENYMALMQALKTERDTRGRPGDFIAASGDFLNFFERSNSYPANVQEAVKRAVGQRLPDLTNYVDQQVRQKRDASPINIPIANLRQLYEATGRRPDRRFSDLADFIDLYNRNAESVAAAAKGADAIRADINKIGSWPGNDVYPQLARRADQLISPGASSSATYGGYAPLPAVTALTREAAQAAREVSTLKDQLNRAGSIVSQINSLRSGGDYRSIIRVLKQNEDIGFLMRQYADVDSRSIDQQEQAIAAAFNRQDWAAAESGLRNLYEDTNFLDPSGVAARKREVTRRVEDNLVSAVEQASKTRINEFIEANKGNYRDVEALYASDAFRPAHVLTFSSGGANVLEQQNQKVQNYLDGLKLDRFPALAIETIYKEFQRDIRTDGVAKGKAIIIHGKYYKGEDQKIKNLIAEVNPSVPKWITKPSEYRKVYLVPVNDAQSGANEYMLRLNIRIPSDAKFPVYDVNLKLPREIAANSETEAWYTSMTLNREPLKNEGRFAITAPTKGNDYTSQITPLRVNKEGNNILEIRFKHSSFKVLEVNVMAQRPIIKK